jgi:hypothetical protein
MTNIELSKRIDFLKGLPLFFGIDEEQYQILASELAEASFPIGKEIARQGMQGDCLYLVWSGKVSLTRKGKDLPAATYQAGDTFGEEAVLVKRHRWAATAIIVENIHLLVLRRDQFQKLLEQAPILKTNFMASATTRRLEQQTHFDWLQPDEVIHFLARKHPFLLWEALVGPGLVALAAIIGMLAAWYYSLWVPALAAVWYLSLFVGVFSIVWGVWNSLDWGNDYYIVTDKRVVWVEKVIGLYQSRRETPLSAILRVNLEMDLSGRMMDYGSILISTIVGSTLMLRNMEHPAYAATLIDRYWKLSRETARRMDQDEINDVLRKRLVDGEELTKPVQSVLTVKQEKKDPYQGQRTLANIFRVRFEDQSTVTYRKHIFVLFKQTLVPVLVVLVLLGFLGYAVFSSSSLGSFFNVQMDLILFIWAVLFVAALLWGIYEYVDWSNDIFQVTPEQILDIDKTPLGRVSNDIAALENILSIESKRIGLLELLFNYGTVYITIGGGQEMAFKDVYDPSAVQEDIERRRLERMAKQEQERINAERERTSDWFATYYKNEQVYRKEQSKPDEEQTEGSQGRMQ